MTRRCLAILLILVIFTSVSNVSLLGLAGPAIAENRENLISRNIVDASANSKSQSSLAPTSPSVSNMPQLTIKSPSAILIDLNSGETLWQKNSDVERPIASTTKMMTAILAIENGDLNETVSINKNVLEAGAEGGVKLSVGENIKLKDLMYALMLNSANDAAVAIADHIGGNVENFLLEMNEKAVTMGAFHTNFRNPHGLDDKMHYSTAQDLSIITRYCLRNKVFADIVSTEKWEMKRKGQRRIKSINNRNELLSSYDGALGVKTGHTDDAGYCLVSAAKRNGVQLVGVVLGAKSQKTVFRESAQMLDYGFGQYENRSVLAKGVTYKSIKSKYGQNVRLTSDKNISITMRKTSKIKTVVWSDNNIEAPLAVGTQLGKIAVLRDDKVIATANVIALDELKKPSYKQILSSYVTQFAQLMF